MKYQRQFLSEELPTCQSAVKPQCHSWHPLKLKEKLPVSLWCPDSWPDWKNTRARGFLSSQELSEDHCPVVRGDAKGTGLETSRWLPRRDPDFVVSDLRMKLSKSDGRFEQKKRESHLKIKYLVGFFFYNFILPILLFLLFFPTDLC